MLAAVCLSVCSVSRELHGPEGSSQQQQGWRSYGAARAPWRGGTAQGQLPGAVLELVPWGLNLWGAPLAPQRERRGWVSCWGHSTRSTTSPSPSPSPAFWRGPGSCPAVQVPEGCAVLVPWLLGGFISPGRSKAVRAVGNTDMNLQLWIFISDRS